MKKTKNTESDRIKNLFTTQLFFMKLFGNISPKMEEFLPPALRNVGYIATKVLAIFRVFLTLHLAVLFVATALNSFYYGELEDLTDALTMLIIYSFATFACLYWIVCSDQLQEFFENVNRDYRYYSMPGLTYATANSPYIIAKKMTKYWLFACVLGVVSWAMSPLILRRRILPVKCWYPFDTSEVYTYEILFFVQFLAQCQMGATFGNGSAIYVSTILIILGQYDILFCSLKNIQSHSKLLPPVLNLFSAQIFFMKLHGHMNPEFNRFFPSAFAWQWLGKLISSLFSFFMAFLLMHLSVLFSFTTLNSIKYGELEDVTDALTMLIIYTYSSFASIYWIFNLKELYNFFMEVNKEYKHRSLIGYTFVSSGESYKVARKITNYWQLIGSVSVIFWSLTPLLIQQRILPIQCWYPFDTKREFVYEALYIVQFLAQLAMCGAYTNGAAVYVSTIVIMLGQYDVLFCSLKNVQVHSELLAGQNMQREEQKSISIDEDELNQYIICKEEKFDMSSLTSRNNSVSPGELQAALKHSMKSCIIHHQFILRSCAKLEKLFNPYCLIKSLQITLQLCLLVFIAVVGDRSIVRSINVIGYVALTLIELFMFTYYGELLRLHSVRAGEALLRSPWHKNTSLIKREILIFLINSKKPVQLTAGKLFVMNVDRLRSVVAQAFSFLTLLQKIAAKKP